jgi:hypothetical protein
VPTWAGEWPVTADRFEFAVIEETENGYLMRSKTRVSAELNFRPEALDVWNWYRKVNA